MHTVVVVRERTTRVKLPGGFFMLKVAMISGWHVHASGYANELKKMNDKVEIGAVWDENPERGISWAKELEVPFIKDLDELLADENIDGVVVNAPTNRHCDIIVAACRAKKHIFTEKVLAPTVKEAKSIEGAVRENNVKFCISFPHRTIPYNLFAKKVVEEGAIGDVTLMRVRNAHNGSIGDWLPAHFYDPIACGGGAMMDLGAHPMYLIHWIMGKPVSISSVFTNYTDRTVEDNAVSLLAFENGAIAVSETGFVSSDSPFSMELYGTGGSLMIGGPDKSVKLKTKDSDWTTPRDMPPALPSPLEQWVEGVINDKKIHFGIEDAVALTQIMDGAYRSYRERKIINL